jgi:CheY-like chemotaxis protein
VQRLVHDHGGSVRAYSDGPGKGTRVVVSLPVVEAQVTRGDPVAGAETPWASVEHNVLVVDDNRDSADALAALLDMHGHQCRVAYDGASALQLAETFPATVGVVDLGLPDMSGFDVARALLARPALGSLRLIALSGYSTAPFRTEAAEAGFSHFFSKPVAIEELLQFLAKG